MSAIPPEGRKWRKGRKNVALKFVTLSSLAPLPRKATREPAVAALGAVCGLLGER